MRLFVLIGALLIAGCAAAPPMATEAQRPEVTINGTTRQTVIDTLIGDHVAKGMTLQSSSPNQIVFGKKIDSIGAAIAFGSRYDSTPEARVIYTIAAQEPSTVRVFASAVMVTNPGSSFERVRDQTPQAARDLQALLERLKGKLNSP